MEALDRLCTTAAGGEASEKLKGHMKALDASMDALAAAVEKRLLNAGSRESLVSATLGAQQALVEKMIPLIDDAGFNLAIGLESAAKTQNLAGIPCCLQTVGSGSEHAPGPVRSPRRGQSAYGSLVGSFALAPEGKVKALANQTGKATEEISAQIAAIQNATHQAVAAIKGIGATIAEISHISTTVAAAVAEQGAATDEIARSTQHAAGATQQVTRSIEVVSQAASKTGITAGEVLQAAAHLGARADELRGEVDAFLSQIRAA